MARLFAAATRRVVPIQVRYVTPVAPDRAEPLVAAVYRRVEQDFGMLAPPIALHSPAPPVLAGAWMMLRESLLANGPASRAAREAVAAGVSRANRCPYCVDVHATALAGLMRGPDTAALLTGRLDELRTEGLSALTGWAGAPDRPPPFPPAHAPQLIAVAVVFHYFNRMVNVFLPDSPLPPVPGPVKTVLRRGAARILGGLAERGHAPGEAPGLLPPAPVPADLDWTAGEPHLAAAFARAGAVIDAAGDRVVPPDVRAMVRDRLSASVAPLPSMTERRWVEDAVAGLATADRAAGRFALLVAYASYRVTPADVAGLRARDLDDRSVVELAAWAALTTARHQGAAAARDWAAHQARWSR
ncbi:carboxymuconolactone decarboxylase family protein [Actinoplanes sp. NPDC051861]|uniref:carboxymuconolactone decarboxylase family protein n=1 Tax=Actinoplanes sp. NPDC051861 TaxID=3155170 RepID=UPI00341AA389